MSCTTSLQFSGQLICNFPQNAEQIDGIAVYFKPIAGEERLVLDCARFVEMECGSNDGLVHEFSNSSHSVITVPDSFARQSGTFRCHAPGVSRSVKPCPWPPVVNKPLDGNGSYQTSFLNPTPLVNSSRFEDGSDNFKGKKGAVIGACFGVAVVIIAILVFAIVLLYKRRKGSRDSKKCRWYKDAIKAYDEESRRQFIRAAVGKRNRSISEHCSDPAATVTVACATPPRISVQQPRQTDLLTRECFTVRMTLSADQNYLVSTTLPRVFVTGPPGTGKTVVLFLKGRQWMQHGNYVYIVSTWEGSRAACNTLYHLLQQTVNLLLAELAPLQLRLLEYDFTQDRDVKKAVNELSRVGKEGPLFILADDPGPDKHSCFKTFCESLVTNVPKLSLWAASRDAEGLPEGWQQKDLSPPSLSIPPVVRQVE